MTTPHDTPKASAGQNGAQEIRDQFPNMEGAIAALVALEDKIEDIKFAMTRNNVSPSRFSDTDSFYDFAISKLSKEDPEFLRKLINLGSCL